MKKEEEIIAYPINMDNIELISPRYEVIDDYPENKYFKVGDILCLETHRNGEVWLHYEYNEAFSAPRTINFQESYFSSYKNIFRKMQWWEQREENDMPKFLKHTLSDSPTTYHKIIKWDMNLLIGYENEKNGCNLRVWSTDYNYQPATEAEYNEYKKS